MFVASQAYQVSSYCLPPHEAITQRRVETLQMILAVEAADEDEDWLDLILFERYQRDHRCYTATNLSGVLWILLAMIMGDCWE
jgi:hypothetical protein